MIYLCQLFIDLYFHHDVLYWLEIRCTYYFQWQTVVAGYFLYDTIVRVAHVEPLYYIMQ